MPQFSLNKINSIIQSTIEQGNNVIEYTKSFKSNSTVIFSNQLLNLKHLHSHLILVKVAFNLILNVQETEKLN